MADSQLPSKPLPKVDNPVVAPFWTALREHRVEMPKCEHCGFVRWPPAPICPECLTPGTVWREVSDRGEIWSYAVYHRAFHPGFADDIPYAIGAVRLDDGPLLTARVDAPPDTIVVGARVHAVYDEVTPEVTLLRWVLDS